MCGRYVLSGTAKVKKRFGLMNNPKVSESYNIAPGTQNLVVVRNSPNRAVFMRWGLIPFWSKNEEIGSKIINARSEGIENKPAFRKPIRSQRCLIPTSGFFEWKKIDLEGREEKYPFFITLKGSNLFSFAGVYDVWKSSKGEEVYTYAIITTSAVGKVKNIHQRMPVILEKSDEDKYLNGKTGLKEILMLLKPIQSNKLSYWPVSKRVNNPENNDSTLLEKIGKI